MHIALDESISQMHKKHIINVVQCIEKCINQPLDFKNTTCGIVLASQASGNLIK